jgi:hypothetical protein
MGAQLLPAFAAACLMGGERGRSTQEFDTSASLLDAILTLNRGSIEPRPAARSELLAVFRQAAEHVSQRDPGAAARHVAVLAKDLTWSSTVEDRLALAHLAVKFAHHTDDETFVSVVSCLYPALVVPRTLPWRLELTGEALAAAQRSGQPVLRFFAAFVRLQCVIESGAGDETDYLLGLLEEIATDGGDPRYEWVAMLCRAWRHIVTGDLLAAHESVAAFRDLGARIGQPETAVACYRLRLAMTAHQGCSASPAADQLVPGMLQLEQQACSFADRELQQGNFGTSIHLLQEEAQHKFSGPSSPDWLATRLLWADVAMQLRACGPALQLYEQLLPYRAHLQLGPLTTSHGAVAQYLGGLAGLLGRNDDADRHYQEAIKLLRRLHAPFHVARAEVAWAHVLGGQAGSDRNDQARALLRDAIAIGERHGCRGVVDEARQELLQQTLQHGALTVVRDERRDSTTTSSLRVEKQTAGGR